SGGALRGAPATGEEGGPQKSSGRLWVPRLEPVSSLAPLQHPPPPNHRCPRPSRAHTPGHPPRGRWGRTRVGGVWGSSRVTGVRQTRQHTVRSVTTRQGLMTRGGGEPHGLISESSQPGGSKVPERRLVGPESGKTRRPPARGGEHLCAGGARTERDRGATCYEAAVGRRKMGPHRAVGTDRHQKSER
uniref:Uncharacterized protein n=1 Tax=Mustela putorius furo TaxID=9669 RepID=M3XTS4_MUSPF